MKKLNYADYMSGDVTIKEEDIKKVEECFNEDIEMTYDEYNRVFDEAGNYIADLIEA